MHGVAKASMTGVIPDRGVVHFSATNVFDASRGLWLARFAVSESNEDVGENLSTCFLLTSGGVVRTALEPGLM
jgi:hypothetical protein